MENGLVESARRGRGFALSPAPPAWRPARDLRRPPDPRPARRPLHRRPRQALRAARRGRPGAVRDALHFGHAVPRPHAVRDAAAGHRAGRVGDGPRDRATCSARSPRTASRPRPSTASSCRTCTSTTPAAPSRAVDGVWRPTFSNAEYAVQRGRADGRRLRRRVRARARASCAETLDRAGQLVLLDGDGPVPGSAAPRSRSRAATPARTRSSGCRPAASPPSTAAT